MSNLASTKSAPTKSDWQPERFDAYDRTLLDALKFARELIGMAEAQAADVAKRRETGDPVVDVHSAAAKWLTLSGKQGSGKTMLARALYEALRRLDPFYSGVWLSGANEHSESNRRPTCQWMHVNEFLDRTLGGWWDYPEWLGRDWVVAIDDVGANRDTKSATASEAIYRLCNARLGKLTLFTTNWTQAEIAERIDPRVQSRMIRDGNVFHRIAVGDYAMAGRK